MHDNLFGWKVPLLHANRGARGALRMAAEGHTLIQDVTWRMQPILIGSSDVKTLVSSFQRLCPNLLSTENPNAILSGSCFGQGVLHEPDKFPTGAIGPAMWWMCRHPLDSSPADRRTGMWWLHIFVHPCIRITICEMLLNISNDVSLLEGPRHLQGGLACFQLRGRNATISIKRALRPFACGINTEETASFTFDWDKCSTVNDLPTKVPHLTILPVNVCLERKGGPQAADESKAKDTGLAYIDSYKTQVMDWVPSTRPTPTARVGDNSVVLVAHCPSDPSLSQNAAANGFDLLCHPSEANTIFQALSGAGNARAIGLVEESFVRMDSEPSLPVFPRDYPDTAAGQNYWNGDLSEWQLLRHSLEEGWGRVDVVKVKKQQNSADGTFPVPKVTWSRISTLPQNASNSGVTVAVVRGDFGKPFIDALAGCGHIPADAPCALKKRRRRRRRVRAPTASVPLCRLTMDEAETQQNTCETLLESLSLPALIRCHVKIEGKGAVATGAKILASMCDVEEQTGYIDYLLGTTAAGSFSMSRGLVHGVGFVGAARLLHVLSSDHGRLSCVAVTGPDGLRHVELKVSLQPSTGGCAKRTATLSLLL